jgi:hypothetical protein
MAREELKWQNIDADDLPAEVKKSFDAMVEAEAAFKADLEKLLKNEGHQSLCCCASPSSVSTPQRSGKRRFRFWHELGHSNRRHYRGFTAGKL